MLAAQTIQLRTNEVVVAGGSESMSRIPHYLPAMRRGSRLGHSKVVDGMLKDGLRDAFHDIHMGECAGEWPKEGEGEVLAGWQPWYLLTMVPGR